jgi:hypothetical protein
MPHVNNLGFAQPIKRVKNGHVMNTDDGKDMLYAQLRQRIRDKIRPGKFTAHTAPYSLIVFVLRPLQQRRAQRCHLSTLRSNTAKRCSIAVCPTFAESKVYCAD